MKEIFKKAMMTGIGIASMTREKLEELAKNIAEESKLAEDEGKKFVDEVLREADEAKKNIEVQVKDLVDRALEKLDLTKKSETEALKAKIAELENKLKEKG